MIVIVCGGRDYADRDKVYQTLDGFDPPIDYVLHGGARGADALARDWAKARGIAVCAIRADWDQYGRKAGPMRNAEMLKFGPQAVIAFPGGRGTADMVRQAKQAGVRVVEVGERS